jgi:ribosomal protein S6
VQQHLQSLQRTGRVIASDRWGQQSFDIIRKAREGSYVIRQYEARQRLPINAA